MINFFDIPNISLMHCIALYKAYQVQQFYESTFEKSETLHGYWYAHFTWEEARALFGQQWKRELERLEAKGYITIKRDLQNKYGDNIIKLVITEKTTNYPVRGMKKSELRRVHKKRLETYKKKRIDSYAYRLNKDAIRILAKTLKYTDIDISEKELTLLYAQRYHQIEKPKTTLQQYIKRGLSIHRHFLEMKKMKDIEDIEYFIATTDFGYRVYHPVLSYVKEAREHIKIKDEETISLDIKQSQVTFLAVKLEKEFGDTTLKDMIMDGRDLYSEIAERKGITRKKAKKLLYFNLFGEIKNIEKIIKEILGKETIRNIIELKYKREKRNLTSKEYNNLAFKLQEIESKAIIRQLIIQLNEKKIKAIPFHDEIRVKKSDKEDALKIFQNILDEMSEKNLFKIKILK